MERLEAVVETKSKLAAGGSGAIYVGKFKKHFAGSPYGATCAIKMLLGKEVQTFYK